MKIIQNNKEYGYQQLIINNVDVLLDVTNNSGLANGIYDLSSSINSYERLIFTVWPQTTESTIAETKYAVSSEVSVSDFTSGYGCAATIWNSTRNYICITNNSSTSIRLSKDTGVICRRIKIEGVKKGNPELNTDLFRFPVYATLQTTAGGESKTFSDYYGNSYTITSSTSDSNTNRGFSIAGGGISKITNAHLVYNFSYGTNVTSADTLAVNNVKPGSTVWFRQRAGINNGTSVTASELSRVASGSNQWVVFNNFLGGTSAGIGFMMDVKLSRTSTSSTRWLATGTIMYTGIVSSCEFDIVITANSANVMPWFEMKSQQTNFTGSCLAELFPIDR